ncbi:MAG: hypothetical protein J6O40_07125 [Ruminococcus sp.]|nr:hypothetical protein [Ruminococcus sp.]
MLNRIRTIFPYLLAIGVIVFVILFVVIDLFLDKPGETAGPGAVQEIKAKIETISEDELICYTDEDIDGNDALGFRAFDKGTRFLLRKDGIKFDIKKLSENDIIHFNLYGEELISDNKYLAHFGDVYLNDEEITYVNAKENIGD